MRLTVGGALCFALSYFASSAAALWAIKNPVSVTGHVSPQLRSCLWVTTQAFKGWSTRTITVSPFNFIRWGQSGCVIDINNGYSFDFLVSGADLAQGFAQLTVVAGSSSPFGVRSTWDGAYPYSPVLTLAHSNYFGGNLGNVITRDVGEDPGFNGTRSTPADPATNEFAAHLASLDFDAMWAEAEAALANTTLADEDVSRLARRASPYKLTNCYDTNDGSLGDRIRECTCKKTKRPTYETRITVTCHGQRSTSSQWTLDRLRKTVGSLSNQIISQAQRGWPGEPNVINSKVNGGFLFVPTNVDPTIKVKARPTADDSSCCEALLNSLAASMGYAPSSCTCDASLPNNLWHMMVSDTAAGIGLGG